MIKEMTVKQIIVVREDLNMSRRKIAAQASMKALVDAMSKGIGLTNEVEEYNLSFSDSENDKEFKE